MSVINSSLKFLLFFFKLQNENFIIETFEKYWDTFLQELGMLLPIL